MNNKVTRIKTIVIGGGQAGLSAGYHLRKQGLPFVILDANQRVGDSWRNRWDSLRLFTPARYVGLDGFPFPAPGDSFPTKDELADYLESYAKRFRLPIRNRVRVDHLTRNGNGFLISAGDECFECENVIVAMANYQQPRIPAFARNLDPAIRQLHSGEYRNPSQLQPGGVLVVGVGNSGADIAVEVARTHPTWIAGKESGVIPYAIEGLFGRHLGIRIIRFIGHHVLSLASPIGRRARPKMLFHTAPLIRIKPDDLVAAGVKRVPRVIGVRHGKPLVGDGHALDVQNVIWGTGFTPGFSWIELPVFGEKGTPLHERGVVSKVPGLYFVGLHFQYAMTSATLAGVGRDAEYVVTHIASHRPIQQVA